MKTDKHTAAASAPSAPPAPWSPSFLTLAARGGLDERLADVKRDFTRPFVWEDRAPLAPPYDLVLTAFSLNFAPDLSAALAAAAVLLEKDGLFLGAMLGGESLGELRLCLAEAEHDLTGAAGPRVLPLPAKEDVSRSLSTAPFHLPVVDGERMELAYTDLFALLRDLRVAWPAIDPALRRPPTSPRRWLTRAAELYARRFPAEGGGISVTIDLLFLHGWKRSP